MVLAIRASFFIAGCASEGEVEDEANLEGWSLGDESMASDVVEPTGQRQGSADVGIEAGCSITDWCDLPNSSIGSVCRQTGCSLSAALDECVVDTWFICGTPKCPWIFKALDGTTFFRDPGPGPRP